MKDGTKKKVAFIQNITNQLFNVMALSAHLKQHGHACDVFVSNFEHNILKRLKDYDPDVLAYSCVTGNMDFGLDLFRRYKRHNQKVLTVMGGPHPTFEPQCVLEDGIDAIVIGEGEGAMLDLCERWDGCQASILDIENLAVACKGELKRNPLRPLIENLDALPYADRDIYDKYVYFRSLNNLSMIASRGCPFNCTYCYSHQLKMLYNRLGRFVRFRSPEHVIGEVRQLIAKYPHLDFIGFDDSTFNSQHAWLLDFLQKYKETCRVPFFCTMRADIANEEQVRMLAEAGCTAVFFAIEAGSYRLRKEILRRDMTDEQIITTAGWIRKYGMKLTVANLLGVPTETEEETWQLVELNMKIHPDRMGSQIFQPYPGTDLGKLSLQLGLIDSIDVNKLGHYYYKSVLNQPGIRLQERVHKLMYYFARWPRLAFLWKILIKYAPFDFLYLMFLVGLVDCFKHNSGFYWYRFIYYGIINVKAFSIFKIGQRRRREMSPAVSGRAPDAK
jgi:radical SAM superfamily enzyme YgiQ (UPF0313 family)